MKKKFIFIVNLSIIFILYIKIGLALQPEKNFKEGLSYLKNREFQKGIQLLKQIPKNHEAFPYASANIGKAYYNLGNQTFDFNYYKEAEKTFKSLIKKYINGKDKRFIYDVKLNLGLSQLPLKKYKEAYKNLTEYKLYSEKCNKSLDFIFLYGYGRLLSFSNKPREAKYYFLQALSLNTNNAFLYFYLGTTYFELRNYQNAKKYYLKAYDKDRFLPDNNIALGLFLLDVEKNPKGKHLIIHGLKDKEYFKLLGINRQKEIFKYLSINKIYYVYDYHYSKFKAFYLTFYIMYLKNKMLYNIIFSCLIILTILIILHKKKILKLKTP